MQARIIALRKHLTINTLVIILFLLTLSVLAISSFYTVQHWVHLAKYPGEIDYAESIVLFEANQLLDGQDIYPLKQDKAFIGAIYGPMLYLINAAACALAPDTFMPLRVMSMLGCFLGLFAIGWIARSRTRGWSASILAIGLALQLPTLIQFGATAKPDSLYLGFTLLGLGVISTNQTSRGILFSAFLFSFALFLKASAIPAPLATFGWLLWRDRKEAFKFVTAMATCCFALLGLSMLLFGARPLLLHLLTYNVAQFDAFQGLVVKPREFLSNSIPIFILLLLIGNWKRDLILYLYFLASFVFHVPLVAKAGGYINYYTEPGIALVLIVATGLGPMLRAIDTSGLRKIAAITFALLLFLAASVSIRPKQQRPAKQSVANDIAAQAELKQLIGDAKPLVFSNEPGNVVRLRRKIQLPIADPFLYNQHVIFGKNRGELFRDLVQAREFDFMLINGYKSIRGNATLESRLTPDQLDEIEKNYVLLKTLPGTEYSDGDIYVFTPKSQ